MSLATTACCAGAICALALASTGTAAAGAPKPAAASKVAPAPKPPELGPTVTRIVTDIRKQNDAYRKLLALCDGIGTRISGSPALEKATEWAVAAMRADGLENVRTEPVMVRRWIRGEESAELLEPRPLALHMLGLGNSVGTPAEGLTGEVVVATDEKTFEALGDRVKGHIVLFDNPMPAFDSKKGTGYGDAVRFRISGPRLAAERGALAVLIRSVTAHSLGAPHTGVTVYGDTKVKIPGAALSVEDAALLDRLVTSGQKVVVRLKMGARDAGEVPSANVIGELRGRELPDEFVVIGGHLDSWDVGQGAHDDGAGVVMSMEAVAALRRLDARPRRTVRVVLFTNEENGGAGAGQYAIDHRAEVDRHVAAIETDMGGFRPRGFGIQMPDKAAQARALNVLRGLSGPLKPLGPLVFEGDRSGSDVGPLGAKGVPALMLLVDESRYFDVHHSPADTPEKVDPTELSEATAAMAAMAYVLADRPERIDAVVGKPAKPGKSTKSGEPGK